MWLGIPDHVGQWRLSSLAVLDQASLHPGLTPARTKQFHHTGWINGLVSAKQAQRRARVQKACGSLRVLSACRSRNGRNAASTRELGRSPAALLLQFADPLVQMSPSPLKAVKRHQQDRNNA